MRGRIKARDDARELAMFGAWQGERFAREEKLRNFGHYAKALKEAPPQGPKDRLAMFRAMQASGVGLKITKLGSGRMMR